jgi:hypothetical protein
MLLSIGTNKDGKLLAYDITNAEELCQELNLKVSKNELEALRKRFDSETQVVEELVEHAYEGHPALVEYDEAATCIRVRVFAKPPTPKVLVGLEGGIVQWVLSDSPVDTLLLDMDIEEDDKKNVTWTDIDGGKAKAVASKEKAMINERYVSRVYREVLPQLDAETL